MTRSAFKLILLVGLAATSFSLSTAFAELSAAIEQDFHSTLEKDAQLLIVQTAGKFLRQESRGEYSTTGFVYTGIHVGHDNTCTDPALVYGEAVNQCFSRGDFFYKLQIFDDECNGAVVQYYADPNCENFLGMKELSDLFGRCEESAISSDMFSSSRFYQSFKCSTSAFPVIPRRAFDEPQCDGLESDLGTGITACSYSASIGYYTTDSCNNIGAIEFAFHATDCKGETSDMTGVCYRSGRAPDNHLSTRDEGYYSESAEDDFYHSYFDDDHINRDDDFVSLPPLGRSTDDVDDHGDAALGESNDRVDDDDWDRPDYVSDSDSDWAMVRANRPPSLVHAELLLEERLAEMWPVDRRRLQSEAEAVGERVEIEQNPEYQMRFCSVAASVSLTGRRARRRAQELVLPLVGGDLLQGIDLQQGLLWLLMVGCVLALGATMVARRRKAGLPEVNTSQGVVLKAPYGPAVV